jgi:branched-chain amino acid transport system ATP-binding protein
MTGDGLLETRGLCRRYGSLAAVDRVDLRIASGARHGLIGPNGAGKTTLLDLLAGSTSPDGGRIRFAGRDVTALGPARRARLGLGRTHQRPAVWPSLSALDNVVVAGWRHAGGFAAAWSTARMRNRMRRPAAEALDRMGLLAEAGTPAGHLSHGQRRQLEIAMALAGGSRLLLLDEPAAGLSTPELLRLWAVLADLPRAVAVLLVEHRLDLVYALADTVTVLRGGRIVTSGAPEQVRHSAAARGAFAEAVR